MKIQRLLQRLELGERPCARRTVRPVKIKRRGATCCERGCHAAAGDRSNQIRYRVRMRHDFVGETHAERALQAHQ